MKKLLLPALAALSVIGAAPASAADVFSDNFESYPASDLNWGGGSVWTTSNVDLVNQPDFGLSCAGGSGNCIDLVGSGAYGTMSKSLDLLAGTYNLSFDYTGNQLSDWPTSDFEVSIASLDSIIGPLSSVGNVFTTYNGWFTLASDATVNLTFSALNNGDNYRGPIIDNVVLSAVPEPTTWALMIFGFMAVGFSMRRRRNTRVSFA